MKKLLLILIVQFYNYISHAQSSCNCSVTICNQTWMTHNLQTSYYRNGDPIPKVTDPSVWSGLTTGAWCWYNNDSATYSVYGKLYNWYAVHDPRGLAPWTWHIPSLAELITLETCLGGSLVAGGALKETGNTHWYTSNTGATNSSGWTGLPGGYRESEGTSYSVLSYGDFWSSTENSVNTASGRRLYYGSAEIYPLDANKHRGMSVRCIRD